MASVVRCSTCKHMQVEGWAEAAELMQPGAEAVRDEELVKACGESHGGPRVLAALERHTHPGRVVDLGCRRGFPLDADDLPPAGFDAAVLGDVLGHIPDPAAALDRVRELLAPRGALALTLPDAGSAFARLMGRRWWSLIPAHRHYFNRRSIEILLARHDFEVLELARLSWVGDRMLVVAGRQGERASLELSDGRGLRKPARGDTH